MSVHTHPVFHICIPDLGCFRELCALCWMLHIRDKLSYSCRQYQKARENVEGKKVCTCIRIRKMNKYYLRSYCLIEDFTAYKSLSFGFLICPSKLKRKCISQYPFRTSKWNLIPAWLSTVSVQWSGHTECCLSLDLLISKNLFRI